MAVGRVDRGRSGRRGAWVLGVVSTAVLATNFLTNLARSADPVDFATHRVGTESLLVGRLVRSREAGVFSDAALLGRYDPPSVGADSTLYQYAAYLGEEDPRDRPYIRYGSQIGGQGIAMAVLDRLLPLEPEPTLFTFRLATAVGTALALALVVVWVYAYLGLGAAVATLLGALFSQWLTLFGANLFWATGSFYLPFLAPAAVLASARRDARPGDPAAHLSDPAGRPAEPTARRTERSLALAVAAALFLKSFLSGYEFITTAFVMALVPIAFHAAWERWPAGMWVRRTSVAAGAGVTGILASVGILLAQLSSVTGTVRQGLEYLLWTFLKRTYWDPADFPAEYAQSLSASVRSVLGRYWNGVAIDLTHVVGDVAWASLYRFTYGELILIFALATAAVFADARLFPRLSGRRRAHGAMAAALWMSLLAPLSWYVVFKSHAALHPHLDQLIWQMPFTLLGFALTGAVGTALAGDAADFLRACRRGTNGGGSEAADTAGRAMEQGPD